LVGNYRERYRRSLVSSHAVGPGVVASVDLTQTDTIGGLPAFNGKNGMEGIVVT
jgi:hypothetical protein